MRCKGNGPGGLSGMKKDNYVAWFPLKGIPARLYCEAVHDDYEGFRVLLRGEAANSPMLRIGFDPALAYRNTDEGNLLKTLSRIHDLGTSSLFVVQDSTWIEWFREESSPVYDGREIVHYAIYSASDCIDVLAEYRPTVEWLNCCS